MDIYCGQLGMLVQLTYCLSMNEGLACRSIIGCWASRTDIMSLLKERFSEAELKKIFEGPAKTRIDRIIESMEKD